MTWSLIYCITSCSRSPEVHAVLSTLFLFCDVVQFARLLCHVASDAGYE